MSPRSRNAPSTPLAWLDSDEQVARRVASLFDESFDGGNVAVSLGDSGGGSWRVTIYFRHEPDEAAARALAALAAGPAVAAALAFEHVVARDWAGDSLKGLNPVEAGRFVVHGAHDRANLPGRRISIEIEAALAFGSGHHGTTRGCLLALDRICNALSAPVPCRQEPGSPAWKPNPTGPLVAGFARRPRPFRSRISRVLDLGTGSGVLAIAAARTLRQQVLAIDVDATAVKVASANVRRNRVAAFVEVAKADGVAALHGRRFDLVVANILLRPLQRFAAPLVKLTAPGGSVILSGLLATQANAALAAYRGLALERRIELEGWTTLVLKRRRVAAVARRRRGP
jgi:ribosomal protein L11 methyltransferase